MTDFVDRLLGRSGRPAIRPLLPTLFEPIGRRDADEPLTMGVFTETAGDGTAERMPGLAEVEPRRIAPMSVLEPLSAPAQDVPAPVVHAESHRSEVHLHHPAVPAIAPSDDRQFPAVAIPAQSEHAAAQSFPAQTGDRPTAREGSPAPRSMRRREDPREPDVHISIGRVEIRATQGKGAPAPRREARKRTTLTLDEYLRSRGADRR